MENFRGVKAGALAGFVCEEEEEEEVVVGVGLTLP